MDLKEDGFKNVLSTFKEQVSVEKVSISSHFFASDVDNSFKWQFPFF